MDRIFHHYNLWEDYHNGMYDECKEGRAERVKQAAHILGTPQICREAMEMVIAEWELATEYNLSNAEINRKAWLGQAACCCYAGIHEDETREAWGIMTEAQRVDANNIAAELIKEWVRKREFEQNPQISMFNDWREIF